MDPQVKNAIYTAVKTEPFARALKMVLVALELGYSHVEMDYDPETMDNIYQRTHGGAIFGLIDEAFETACQTHGTIAVAFERERHLCCQPTIQSSFAGDRPGNKPDQKNRIL